MKTIVRVDSFKKGLVRITSVIAAFSLLVGPASAADPQMLTNTSLPVSSLSEKQTRRLLSAANLKAKMKSAMRLANKRGGAKPAEAGNPALAMSTPGTTPKAVAPDLRPPIAITQTNTAQETTSPGWSDEADPLSSPANNASPAVPVQAAVAGTAASPPAPAATTQTPANAKEPAVDATFAFSTNKTVEATTTAPAAVATETAGAPGTASSSSDTESTPPASAYPASNTADAPSATTTSDALSAAAPSAENLASASSATDTGAAPATADTDTSAAGAQKVGQFTVASLGGDSLKPGNGALAMSPDIAATAITASPVFIDGQALDGPIVIDNDELQEQTITIAYEELPTDDGGTAVKAGARFPVVMVSELNSKTAKKGDPIEARLKYDLKIGSRHIANKGSRVRGHLDYVLKARTVLGSMITTQRFYRNSGVLGIAFDELINEKGEHFKLAAKPAMMDRIVKNKYEGRELGVNHNGQVTGPFSQQLRYKAIRVGMNFAMAPLGPMTFGAMPVALGVMGAINPSFAFMKPVGLNVRHRRIKGFAWAFLSGIPGSWLIEDTTVRGQEAIIKPGDEFLAVFNEQFKGEAVTDASLIPGAGTKVRGEVLSGVKEPTKKKGR